MELPTKEEVLRLDKEDEERLYSPPVTKDEMTSDDLPSVHEVLGTLLLLLVNILWVVLNWYLCRRFHI